ncbi:transcriptional regulator, HxlR family [Kribbella flavida DSM 17836]|uniref:Transcriptional regulator, HxlR family n=1 Tax=Kribbella flavida (strain DSM 17836 / JCM 10339 / NBRC 14399) TaxID=479435 RepID=D2PME8_KRIFD|nr:helix-turn-helix domain-containing protein [Kribbella flavida]ADB30692.1 transcriptional regulator, HxlR family [Kribbella flavida DSM 17836]
MKYPEADSCGLGAALRVIGGRWKAALIWELHAGPVRFAELRRRVPGISEKVLFLQLRELEADGVVSRRVVREKPIWVEYRLTADGAQLNDAVHALAEWGKAYATPPPRTTEGPMVLNTP